MSNGSDDKRTLVGTGPDTPEPQASEQEARPPSDVTPGEPPPDPLVGTTLLERYYIERKLGEGGMGSVYLARHTTLEKPVALKVLHGEFTRKPDLIERFLQEAKAASRIRHQNVIDITDFGQTPENLVFFAMEFLEGRDLHEELGRARLENRPIPWERSKKIFLQVCSALAAAHAHGIIHRDLKPENIYLVEWGGEQDFVKLLDFGIAKMTEVSEEGRKLTRTGMLFGTPEYMSPEQARGEKPDHRVDVYAMGCILYQLLSGRVPFESDTFMGILSLHLSEEPPPLGAALAQVGAPPAIEGVVMRALSKDREERYADMEQLADAVRAADGEAGVEAPPPPAPADQPRRKGWTGRVRIPDESEEAAPAPTRSSKKPLLLGAAAIVALAGGFAIAASVIGGGESEPAGAPAADAAAEMDEIPEQVSVTVRTDPEGATVMDDATGEVFGKTPITFDLAGAEQPRSLRIAKDGYEAQIREIIPSEDRVIARALDELEGAGSDEPPDAKKPDGRKPDGRKPDGRKPDGRKPDSRKPDNRKPDNRKPDTKKPGDRKPDGADQPDDDPDEPKLKDPFGGGG